MRVRIIFELNNRGSAVPFHHQYLLAELIENIRNSLEDYGDYSRFNFSGLKGQTKIGKSGLHFYSSKITLVLSSPNKAFIDQFLQKLFEQNQYHLGQLDISPDSVEIEKEAELGESTKFICISPLVTSGRNDPDGPSKMFINPYDDRFSDMLYESTLGRMEETGDYTPEQLTDFYKFQIVPDKNYLEKIRREEKKFSRIYPVYLDGTKMELRGYTFPFTFYVHPEVQRFIFDSGFGEYTEKGFGMMDLANVNPVGRSAPYQF